MGCVVAESAYFVISFVRKGAQQYLIDTITAIRVVKLHLQETNGKLQADWIGLQRVSKNLPDNYNRAHYKCKSKMSKCPFILSSSWNPSSCERRRGPALSEEPTRLPCMRTAKGTPAEQWRGEEAEDLDDGVDDEGCEEDAGDEEGDDVHEEVLEDVQVVRAAPGLRDLQGKHFILYLRPRLGSPMPLCGG